MSKLEQTRSVVEELDNLFREARYEGRATIVLESAVGSRFNAIVVEAIKELDAAGATLPKTAAVPGFDEALHRMIP